jgi:hypothetical protein
MPLSRNTAAEESTMQRRRIARMLTAGSLAIALASAGAAPALAASSAKQPKAPLLKALSYTPLTTDGSDGFLEARFTATVELYQAAPSIYFDVDSVGSNNIAVEEGPHASYKPGLRKVSFIADALPEGTFRITLVAREGPPLRLVKSSDPATLVIAPAAEGAAGTGMVTKI